MPRKLFHSLCCCIRPSDSYKKHLADTVDGRVGGAGVDSYQLEPVATADGPSTLPMIHSHSVAGQSKNGHPATVTTTTTVKATIPHNNSSSAVQAASAAHHASLAAARGAAVTTTATAPTATTTTTGPYGAFHQHRATASNGGGGGEANLAVKPYQRYGTSNAATIPVNSNVPTTAAQQRPATIARYGGGGGGSNGGGTTGRRGVSSPFSPESLIHQVQPGNQEAVTGPARSPTGSVGLWFGRRLKAQQAAQRPSTPTGGVAKTAMDGPHLLSRPRPTDLHKKCLIIDLDETLVHSSFKPVKNADFIIPVEIDNIVHQVYVLKRPNADEFLERVGRLFECVLFTASLAKYADPVANLLDKRGVFRARLFREACVFFEGNYVKDLDRLGRDRDRIVIVDNSPASYAFHPENAVPVGTWFDDPNDSELLELLPLMEVLADCENIYSVLTQQELHKAEKQPPRSGQLPATPNTAASNHYPVTPPPVIPPTTTTTAPSTMPNGLNLLDELLLIDEGDGGGGGGTVPRSGGGIAGRRGPFMVSSSTISFITEPARRSTPTLVTPTTPPNAAVTSDAGAGRRLPNSATTIPITIQRSSYMATGPSSTTYGAAVNSTSTLPASLKSRHLLSNNTIAKGVEGSSNFQQRMAPSSVTTSYVFNGADGARPGGATKSTTSRTHATSVVGNHNGPDQAAGKTRMGGGSMLGSNKERR